MRVLVTGAGGLLGSNLAAAAVQQSWEVLGTWRALPVSVPGVDTAQLDVADRHACVMLAAEFEPDVLVHAVVPSSPARLEREPQLVEACTVAAANTLAAARTVRARYVAVSSEHVFSGERAAGERWTEDDLTAPRSALGCALQECEQLVEEYPCGWLITRPSETYGVNLAIPTTIHRSGRSGRGAGWSGRGAGPPPDHPPSGPEHRYARPSPSPEHPPALAVAAFAARARHVWERSGAALRWVAWLRAGRPLAAPVGIVRTPTYAWDYAQVVCELLAQECEGVYHTAGRTALGRLAYLRLVARAFACDPRLVQEGSLAECLRACGEELDGEDVLARLAPANLALCDGRASFVVGRAGVDPFVGLRQARRQLERVLGRLEHAEGAALGLAPEAQDGGLDNGWCNGDGTDVESADAPRRAWGGLG
jgi:dTDP-4-dehydrorhamnose reductase